MGLVCMVTTPAPATGGQAVPDDVNDLAQEYFDFLLTAWPSWGHMMGIYDHADRFDDVSRDGEEAQRQASLAFAARAEAIPANGLSKQDAITREMLSGMRRSSSRGSRSSASTRSSANRPGSPCGCRSSRSRTPTSPRR
jgi:uncharacterized protein (DUF885 family)